ncbi:glyoxalase [Pandoraea terrae]|uniref:Glyoxalase n=2 Tax=Pandoraea terrae TaxID=1537710 RepID=A0A5E4U6F0_9BURK|nr:glyoxalase [Pandoraea terrae]
MMSRNAVPIQIAYVTQDLAAMEDALSRQLGIKKWIRNTGYRTDPARTSYRGIPVCFEVDLSLSYAGDMQIEIIAPVSGDDNPYDDFLRTHGPGLHHICIEVDNIEKALQDYAANGIEAVFRIAIPEAGDYAYIRSPAMGAAYVELAVFTPEIKQHFEFIKSECR